MAITSTGKNYNIPLSLTALKNNVAQGVPSVNVLGEEITNNKKGISFSDASFYENASTSCIKNTSFQKTINDYTDPKNALHPQVAARLSGVKRQIANYNEKQKLPIDQVEMNIAQDPRMVRMRKYSLINGEITDKQTALSVLDGLYKDNRSNPNELAEFATLASIKALFTEDEADRQIFTQKAILYQKEAVRVAYYKFIFSDKDFRVDAAFMVAANLLDLSYLLADDQKEYKVQLLNNAITILNSLPRDNMNKYVIELIDGIQTKINETLAKLSVDKK
ncbi:MAG: hypothetical protein JW841_02955 [Deltaproteobacteria bacterium]|nr:hypothetical protein [Deltaproteobacteria bacterium]